jgi:hypothetical protein
VYFSKYGKTDRSIRSISARCITAQGGGAPVGTVAMIVVMTVFVLKR